MARELLTPILEGGIRNAHFFEGRLLAATDLAAEQKAHRTHHEQLGRAVGAGIVSGLEVEVEAAGTGGSPPVLAVAPGLAVNRKGQTLELPGREQVSLVRSSASAGAGPRLFSNCSQPRPTQVPVGVGLYLLVLSPADGFAERAPKSGLGGDGRVIGCGSRYAVEGVQLRLELVEPARLSGLSQATRDLLQQELAQATSPARLSRLRNLAAHLCFGTEKAARFAVDPFGREDGAAAVFSHGALDDLAAAGRLTDCDVPLALFFWSLSGIAFLDLWAVRRRPAEREPSSRWPWIAARARADAEAVFLQFQDHLESLARTLTNPAVIEARSFFRYLPPAGLLPIQSASRSRGVLVPSFFQGKTWRGPIVLEGARLSQVLARSLDLPPVDLESPEMLWLYDLRENLQPAPGAAAPPAPETVVFTSGFMDFQADARFDMSRFHYSNFSSPSL